jgi:hypothetical protein
MTRTPTLQTRQNWHNHLPNKTTARDFFFADCIVASHVTRVRISLSLSLSVARHDVIHQAVFKPELSAGERTVADLYSHLSTESEFC